MSKQTAKRVDQHVGDAVRRVRVERGLTQNDLAKALGLSYQQVQKYETGANRISAGKLYELATVLKVDPHSFFDGLDLPKRAPATPAAPAVEGTVDVARSFESIGDNELRSAISALVKCLSGRSRRRRS